MFWTDWGSAAKIEKATLTGGQRVAIVTSNLQWPHGMDLDRGNKRIYWVDGGTDRIESVNYQGNNRILLSKFTGFLAFGVAMISPFLFFTDLVPGDALHKLDADTGNYIVSNYRTRGTLKGIVAYDQSRQPPGMGPHPHIIQQIKWSVSKRTNVNYHSRKDIHQNIIEIDVFLF